MYALKPFLKMILGISGTNSAGKDSVARILKDAGFEQFSLSDAIREEAKARGLPSDRDVLIKLGNELREKLGPGILGERILDLIKKKRSRRHLSSASVIPPKPRRSQIMMTSSLCGSTPLHSLDMSDRWRDIVINPIRSRMMISSRWRTLRETLVRPVRGLTS